MMQPAFRQTVRARLGAREHCATFQRGCVNTEGISTRRRARFTRDVLRWTTQNYRPFGWRRETDPYRVLLAEILLQRTQAVQVASNLQAVLQRFPTVDDLAGTSEEEIAAAIQPFGLAKRGKALSLLAKTICSDFAGSIPREPALLQSLPGIGRYISSAVACFAYGHAVPVVDANVIRVLCRYFGLSPQKSRAREDLALWRFAAVLIPKRKAQEFNWGLIDFAALVCKPRKPDCPVCPMRDQCVWASHSI